MRPTAPEKSQQGKIISDPNWKGGKFRELSIEGLQTNLEIVVTKLKMILKAPKKRINASEVCTLTNALSGLIRVGLLLQDKQQERQEMIQHIRQEFALLTRQELGKHPELVKQIDSVMAEFRLPGEPE